MRLRRETRDDDPVRDREGATGEAGARAARDERDAVARTETQHRLHLLGRPREHDAGRLCAPAREAVAVVGRELLGLGDDVVVAERVPEVADELRSERHDDDPTAGADPTASIIDDRSIGQVDRIGSRLMTVPIPRPGKIVCVGLNYKDHAEEQGAELPGGAAPLREVHDRRSSGPATRS